MSLVGCRSSQYGAWLTRDDHWRRENLLYPLGPWVYPDAEEDDKLNAEEDETRGQRDDKGLHGRANFGLGCARAAIEESSKVSHVDAVQIATSTWFRSSSTS